MFEPLHATCTVTVSYQTDRLEDRQTWSQNKPVAKMNFNCIFYSTNVETPLKRRRVFCVQKELANN